MDQVVQVPVMQAVVEVVDEGTPDALNTSWVWEPPEGSRAVTVELVDTTTLWVLPSQATVAGDGVDPLLERVSVAWGAEFAMVHLTGRVTAVERSVKADAGA